VFELNGWYGHIYTPIGRQITKCGGINGDGLDDIMFSAWGGGIRRSRGEVSIIGGTEEWQTGIDDDSGQPIPVDYGLRTYPNPFNSSVNIQFSLVRALHSQVEVLDISGRMVDLLHEGELSAGDYNFSWEAPSAGLFFAVL